MVTDEQYDGLVNTIQREMAKLYEQNLILSDEVNTLKGEVNKLKQFSSTEKGY